MEPIPVAGPWVSARDVDVVVDALTNGWYEKAYWYVETFEREFARFHGRRFGVMTPNCTSALHLLLRALGIGEGDEVVVPDCTWIGSSAPISYVRATPVFCDIEPENWCLDPEAAGRRLTSRTKAIIAVGLFGNMPRMDELRALAARHGVPLIEDAAESLGSVYRDIRSGGFGVGSVFSFHRTKTLTTGEGGMLLLDDEDLYERCLMLRDHGRTRGGPPYYFREVTPKYMPFNVQAALGYAQFQRLSELLARKRAIFERYKAHLADLPDLQLNNEPPGVVNSVWMTTVVFGTRHRISREQAMNALASLGVPSRPFFHPLTSVPAYAPFRAQGDRNRCAYGISGRGVSLPSALALTEDQVDFVAGAVRAILGYPPLDRDRLSPAAAVPQVA